MGMNEEGGLSGRCERAEESLGAAYSELAALREELAKFEGEIVAALPGVRFMDLPDGGAPTLAEQVKRMSEALTAAEQRNADTIAKLELAASMMDDDERGNRFAEVCRAAIESLKPTESGASE